MEGLKIKAYAYAEKVDRVNAMTVIDFMAGFQASEHTDPQVKLDQLSDYFKENFHDVPKDILDSIENLKVEIALFKETPDN